VNVPASSSALQALRLHILPCTIGRAITAQPFARRRKLHLEGGRRDQQERENSKLNTGPSVAECLDRLTRDRTRALTLACPGKGVVPIEGSYLSNWIVYSIARKTVFEIPVGISANPSGQKIEGATMGKKPSWLVSLEILRSESRQLCRQLLKAPLFSITGVLVLAAGFGVSVTIFSIVRNVLLTPLPYKDPERLVQIVSQWPKTGDRNDWSAPLRDAIDWKNTVPAFEDLAIYHYSLFNLTEGGQAESIYGLRVTANLLPMLGVRPQLGKWFPPEYDRPDNSHVIVLSDDLWRRRFHSDSAIVGKTIHLDSKGYEVVAVMPRGFNFPLKLGTTAQLPTDQMQFWMPLGIDPASKPHGVPNDGVIARLKPDVTLSLAQAQLENACTLLAREYPESNRDLSARVSLLRDQTVRQVNAPLLALLIATALIFLLACANIAGLLLARGESHAGELAVRMALGGSAWRVARLPMLEGFLLCCFGCLLGAPLAMAGVRLLLHLAPMNVPRLASTRVDSNALLFAAVLALGSGVLIGGLNALQVMRRSPRDVLLGSLRTSAGRPRTRLRSSLVVGQIALAVVLISSAGLMLRTFLNLLSTDTGYHARHVFYGVTVLPTSQYAQFEQRQLFFRKVLDRLRSMPEIESAAVSTGFPFVGQYDSTKVQSAEIARNSQDAGISADFNAVSAGYLETLGVRLVRGRLLAETDVADAPKVVVIDEGLARAFWPGKNPIGQLIRTGDPSKLEWRQVIGVLSPVRNKSLDIAPRPGVFVPLDQTQGYVNFVVLKTSAGPPEASRLLRDVVAGVDANQGVFIIQSLPDLINDTIAARRFLFLVLVFFGGTALVLSALSIYGLIAFIAVSRTREMGIRIALGATRGNIRRLIVSDGVRLTLFGAGAGVLTMALVGRLLSSLLFGVRELDVATIALTITILGITTALAALIPAWRSTRIQPMAAIRTD
jgi:putative ABC transport system permease protein